MISTFLLLAIVACFFAMTIASEALVAGSSTAKLTYYNSYPFCCPKSPNYDPNAPTDECDDYSGCKYMGDFAAIGHKSIDYVKTDPTGKNFDKNWANRNITVSKSCNGKTYTFTCLIADTCGNGDCNNCCSRNSDKTTGYLIDMEYYTVMNNFGTTDCASGSISFTF